MVDAHQWGTPVREWTDPDAYVADVKARKARLRAARGCIEVERQAIRPRLTLGVRPIDDPEAVVRKAAESLARREKTIRDWLDLAPPAAVDKAPYQVVIDIVREWASVSEIDLISERRAANLAEARQIAGWLMRHHTTMSLPQIGHRIGDRDHTTILHGCRRVDARRQADDAFRTVLDGLSAKVAERLSP